MKITALTIPDILLICPQVYADERGFFMETFNSIDFVKAGLPSQFVQQNHSGSRKGVLRGLHYQIKQPQGKLVKVMIGEIYEVAVDIRAGSPTFGKWVGINMAAKDHCQLWIPVGFAHGFYILSDWVEVTYQTTNPYAPEWERTILWNDADLNIAWPLDGTAPLLSKKDAQGKHLAEAEVFQMDRNE
jgi:dTDP-4-dehydrorhamnose 3,5-epimerase